MWGGGERGRGWRGRVGWGVFIVCRGGEVAWVWCVAVCVAVCGGGVVFAGVWRCGSVGVRWGVVVCVCVWRCGRVVCGGVCGWVAVCD